MADFTWLIDSRCFQKVLDLCEEIVALHQACGHQGFEVVCCFAVFFQYFLRIFNDVYYLTNLSEGPESGLLKVVYLLL